MIEENVKLVRAFYDATVPGRREPLDEFLWREFIAGGDQIVALGRIEATTRLGSVPVNVPFAHVWTAPNGYLQRLRAFTDTAVIARALSKEGASSGREKARGPLAGRRERGEYRK